MQNIFKYIFLSLILIYLGFLVWKTYFGDPTQLEKDNKDLKTKNENIQKTRDSLDKINKLLFIKYDSVFKIKNRLFEDIKKLEGEYEVLERKSKKNLDSANKWKNIYINNRKEIEELKKNRKLPSNQETLDFFQKY
jgi:hypothetical protein